MVVHTAEEWPTGPLCRNDGASYPCRLHRWGRRVLEAHGLNERQVEALIRHGNPFVHVPFPFTATGPSRQQAARVVPPGVRPTAAGRPVTPRHRAALAPGELSAYPPPNPTRATRRRPGTEIFLRAGPTSLDRRTQSLPAPIPQSGADQLVVFELLSLLFSRRESTCTWSSWSG
ncbi:hypothetical protein NKG94_27985 [Micromonospora sp. M12]